MAAYPVETGQDRRPRPAYRAALWRNLYKAVWYPALPVALLAAGGRDPQLRRERLGRAGACANQDHRARRIWIHAASVGEIEAVRPLVLRLNRSGLALQIVVTTMTATGRDAARRRLPQIDRALMAPLDFAPAMRAFAKGLRPDLLIIAETELWPNMIAEAARVGARVVLVNARLSSRSARRYRLIRPLLAVALANVARIYAQTAQDGDRFVALGAETPQLTVSGNIKFSREAESAAPRLALREFAKGRQVLLAGSTGPGEERVVVESFCALRRQFPELALILAPRHLERSAEVEQVLAAASLKSVMASEIRESPPPCDCLLLDTMGELRALYSCATVAFVGGSLFPGRGGQSLIEPADAAIPVLFGPYHESQRVIADELIRNHAGIVVKDAHTLMAAAAAWLCDEELRKNAGERARAAVTRLSSGVERIAAELLELLSAVPRAH